MDGNAPESYSSAGLIRACLTREWVPEGDCGDIAAHTMMVGEKIEV